MKTHPNSNETRVRLDQLTAQIKYYGVKHPTGGAWFVKDRLGDFEVFVVFCPILGKFPDKLLLSYRKSYTDQSMETWSQEIHTNELKLESGTPIPAFASNCIIHQTFTPGTHNEGPVEVVIPGQSQELAVNSILTCAENHVNAALKTHK